MCCLTCSRGLSQRSWCPGFLCHSCTESRQPFRTRSVAPLPFSNWCTTNIPRKRFPPIRTRRRPVSRKIGGPRCRAIGIEYLIPFKSSRQARIRSRAKACLPTRCTTFSRLMKKYSVSLRQCLDALPLPTQFRQPPVIGPTPFSSGRKYPAHALAQSENCEPNVVCRCV